jgi:hypothetical protein
VAGSGVTRQGGYVGWRRGETGGEDCIERALLVEARELPDAEPDEQRRAGEGDGEGEECALAQ